jgi:hypothetical protein
MIPQPFILQAFIIKWRFVQLKERSAYQEYFSDLGRLVGQPAPADARICLKRPRKSYNRPQKLMNRP